MNEKFGSANVYDFFKSLVELGGFYYVDQNRIIHSSVDDVPVGVQVNKKSYPIAILKEKMSIGNYVVLCPLTETVGYSPEREWFFTKNSLFIGIMLQQIMIKTVENAISKDTTLDYGKLPILNEYLDKLDEKMLKEIEKIRPAQWAVLYYDKKTHTAQLQSEIFSEELQKEIGNKIRKQSWEVFRGIVEMILGTRTPEKVYTYTATIVSIPRSDATLHVLIQACKQIDDLCKKILDIDLHSDELEYHLSHLEQYQKAVNWFATGASVADVTAKKTETPPWSNAYSKEGVPVPNGGIPTTSASPSNVPFPGSPYTASGVPIGQPSVTAMRFAQTPLYPTSSNVPMPSSSFGGYTASGVPVNAPAITSIIGNRY